MKKLILFSIIIKFVFAQDFIVKNYNIENGLVQSTVREIFQDSMGFIWIGTNKGLSRFDGKEFKNYKTSDSLFYNGIIRITQDSKNNLLLVTLKGELWEFDGINFTKHTIHNKAKILVSDIKIVNKILIIGTYDSGCYTFENNTLKKFDTSQGLYDNRIQSLEVYNEDIYIISLGGINLLKNGKVYPFLQNTNFQYSTIFKDSDGSIFLGVVKKGIYKLDNNNLTPILKDEKTIFLKIREDKDKNIWCSGTNGLIRLIKKNENQYISQIELNAHQIRRVFIDSENNIWAASLGRGLYKLRKALFTNYRYEDGFPDYFARVLLIDSKDRLWLALVNNGVSMFDGNKFHYFSLKEGLSSQDVTEATETPQGDILISAGINIHKFVNNKFIVEDRKNLPEKRIYVLEYDSKGRLWAGLSGDNFWYYENDKWKELQLIEGSKLFYPNNIFEDSKNNLWFISFNEGLYNYNGKTITKYSKDNGLTDNRLYVVGEDLKQNIWVGSEEGINIINSQNKIDSLYDNNGRIDKAIFAINRYKNKMFFATSDGLGLFDNERIKYFTTLDGLSTNDLSAYRIDFDKKGNLWIGTTAGLSKFDVEKYFNTDYITTAYISRIICDEDTLNINFLKSPNSFPSEFSSTLDFIHFDLKTISYTEDIKSYRYKLDSNDKNWHYSENGRISIDNPKAGNYNLVIQTLSFGNNWKQAIRFKINIVDPFYKSTYFIIAIILILISLVAYTIYYRSVQKEKNKYKTSSLNEKRKNEIKTKLLELINDKKQFKDPTLTLQKISIELNIPKEHISQVLNVDIKQNYNDYINSIRISEAKKMLAENDENLSIIQIAYEVGFNSKSSFNSAFKKFTNQTPTEFKNSLKHN